MSTEPKLLKKCVNGGIVKIKMVLHKSGQVTDVTFIENNGCENIEEEKIIASIRKLKFSTAMKNGVPVSQIVVKTLQFSSL